jgi:transcriptional regulator with GAF, ATPase, and Fis domain
MAYLKCIDGLDRSTRVFPLKKPLVSIGRQRGCDIQLQDDAVDGTHANLLKKGSAYQLHVLSRNGKLLLNGQQVRKGLMHVGDRLSLGRFELVLLDGAAPKPKKEATRDVRALERLVDFSAKLMRETHPEKLFQHLLAAVVDLTRAEKGFIIVLKDGERHLAAAHKVGKEILDLSEVSDTILDKVIESMKPIIISDALSDKRFGNAKSVVDLRLSSVMCVPLIYRNELLGLIYLGNDAITGLFTEEDLQLLKVWATQASLILHTALMLNELKISNQNLREQLRQNDSGGAIIGSCDGMKRVFQMIKKLAPTDLSVLVLGETGTGKEMVAKELHSSSERKDRPFISINCGAIPENLLESELFGHKKGSFTGAVSDKVGKFEAANKGTIFLDEIGEMPMNLQVKLLRVLQERKIERVGDLKPRKVDIRVISATNKELETEIKEGRFREDLYYRLAEVSVQLPPLRDRGNDIHELAMFFLNKYAEQYSSKVRGFNNGTVRAMLGYYWPGNVRQLENRIKRSVIMSDRALLSPDDVGINTDQRREIRQLDEATEEFKLGYIRDALEFNNWNKAQTARELGVDPRTIFRYLEKINN